MAAFRFRIILEMFHVKHFRPIGAQNLTRRETALHIDLVRSIDFLVQLESGAGGVSMSRTIQEASTGVRFTHKKVVIWNDRTVA
jgi:hypothetical protein